MMIGGKCKRCLLVWLLSVSGGLAAPETPQLLWLPLNEGRGDFAVDHSPNQIEADFANVRWATTGAAAAACFSGTNSTIDIPDVKGLDKATQFTISLWVLWDGAPTRYPNIISTRNWSPGGLLIFVSDNSCSFRMGRPGERAGAPGSAWSEVGVPMLDALPQRQWTHLCVTFAMPDIITYVNGKERARGKWNYPVAAQGLRLGGWTGANSHKGLLADLRIYSEALPPADITALAANTARQNGEYTIISESTKNIKPVVTLANRHVILDIDDTGRAISLREKATKRELLAQADPLVHITLDDGRRVTARKLQKIGKELHFIFSNKRGEVVVSADAQDDFFIFTVRSLNVTNVATLNFCTLTPAVKQYIGDMANMYSDDTSAICLRGFELPVEMSVQGGQLRVWNTPEHGLTGWRAGLAAGPKTKMQKMLQSMAQYAAVPTSKNCGPWALGAEANRGSYLFADLSHAATDDWIELAQRGGFSTIHLHGWWETLGHYELSKTYFPNGLDDMRDTVKRIHAAGLRAGIHTLTGCIDTRDSWITPITSPHLIPFESYTLARGITAEDDTLIVNEMPTTRHDTVFTYSGNGNAIRIGTEIIQYSNISRTPPYTFGNCKRGAFGTKAAPHKAGEQADYLQQRYLAFYPQPDSPLADELAACIARVYNACELDQLYFDGSEGMMSRYGIDAMRHKIFKLLQGEPLTEASCHGKHNWWLHSRLGAWDHAVWAPKRFQDSHIASAAQYRKSDMLETQMGWWAPRGPSQIAHGHFLDDMEYFACKNLGLDSASSIQGVNVSYAPLSCYIEQQITLLGWYDHLRLARYFDAQTIARITPPGAEFRLRQDDDGNWRFTPVASMIHRFTRPDDRWLCTNPYPSQPLSFRLEALQAAAPYTAPEAVTLIAADEFKTLKTSTANGNVKLELQAETQDTRGTAHNLRLLATNQGATSSGAWARAMLEFPDPYRNLGKSAAFGVWVKGDGQGALLNIQLGTPREYMHATSDHYVKLNFSGWRYVELLPRERDVDQMHNYLWPYGGAYTIYRTPLDMAHISHLAVYLNDLPSGKKVEVVLSPIMAVPAHKVQIADPVIALNGQELPLPFTMTSGDFIELEPDGQCTHFDERGFPLTRIALFANQDHPLSRAGENQLEFKCTQPTNGNGRAELTLNFFGEKFGSRNVAAHIDRKYMRREYVMPFPVIAPDNAPETIALSVRPKEQAHLEVEIWGSVTAPTLAWGDTLLRFPVEIKEKQRLICRDGQTWKLLDASRKLIGEGSLAKPIPPLGSGRHVITFSSEARNQPIVKLVKVYK